MELFTKNSLELLRQRIDLVEVLTPYVQFTKSGAFYKSRCPFHEEKTPSFMIQRGQTHYHCYGCGAHGDAIQFLMTYLKISFSESVEMLAERFHINLEVTEKNNKELGPNKKVLKDALNKSLRFYHFMLLHTQEGHEALSYLYNRGIDLEFIKKFQLGLAPKNTFLFQKTMYEQRIKKEVLHDSGLINKNGRDFFSDRIMFPILDVMGAVIGFSARKYREDTFGPKYVNTPETILFKKSRILFGLSFCRKRIAKERKAIIVEGQLDALRLIYAGFNITVAGQGTAFGNDHVQELIKLGVNHVYLAMDPDDAGQNAAEKIGHLFQKEAIEVSVVEIPQGMDPDVILMEKGPNKWQECLDNSVDYLTFLYKKLSKTININLPAGKNELVQMLAGRVREWDHPLMIHEGARKIAQLTHVPESVIEIDKSQAPNIYIKKSASIAHEDVDADRILETDLLRWLYWVGEEKGNLVEIAKNNLSGEYFYVGVCRRLYEMYIQAYEDKKPRDLLSMNIDLEQVEDQIFFSEMLSKKINKDKAEEIFIESVKKILERHWLREKEKIREKIQRGECSQEDLFLLAKQFDEVNKNKPIVTIAQKEPAEE